MGAILGTVPGWERGSKWTPGYRIYSGPAYLKYEIPPEKISPEVSHEYRVKLDITVYLCDSPDLQFPLVIREIKGITIIHIYDEEYPGGLEQWVSDVSIREAEELLARSHREVAGLVPCEKGYDVNTYEEEYKPPIAVTPPIAVKIPKYILDEIEYMERFYKESESVDEKLAIREEINRIKKRYGIKD